MKMYHPVWQEMLGAALALGGIVIWLAGMLLILRYAGKGSFT